MDTSVIFLDCPVKSTDGPLESAKIRCPRGHGFNGPIASLTWRKHPGDSTARTSSDAAVGLPVFLYFAEP